MEDNSIHMQRKYRQSRANGTRLSPTVANNIYIDEEMDIIIISTDSYIIVNHEFIDIDNDQPPAMWSKPLVMELVHSRCKAHAYARWTALSSPPY